MTLLGAGAAESAGTGVVHFEITCSIYPKSLLLAGTIFKRKCGNLLILLN